MRNGKMRREDMHMLRKLEMDNIERKNMLPTFDNDALF